MQTDNLLQIIVTVITLVIAAIVGYGMIRWREWRYLKSHSLAQEFLERTAAARVLELEATLKEIKEIVGSTAASSNPRDYIEANAKLMDMLWTDKRQD